MNNDTRSWIDTSWERFAIEGDVLFKYMTEHYQDMFDGDIIKHFDMRCEDVMDLGSQELMEEHGPEIEKELVIWIRNEYQKGCLFDNTNWRPVRDICTFTGMYMGYRRMFQFKHYFLQLVIEKKCQGCYNCKYCVNKENTIHFQLVLCGWKVNDDDTFIEPYSDFPILPDNIMPEKYWNMK